MSDDEFICGFCGYDNGEALEDAFRNTEALVIVVSPGPNFCWSIWIPRASTLTALISTLSMGLKRSVVRAVMTLVGVVYFAEDASGAVTSWLLAGAAVARASVIKLY